MSNEEMVPLKDAQDQVRKTAIRLALIHLGFSKVLVDEFGEEKAKELVIKSMVEYGKLVDKHQQWDNLPYYGLHEKHSYKNQEYEDARNIPLTEGESFDYAKLKVYGCEIGKTFIDLDEEELGRLYCYVDASKSMAEDPSKKLIHSDCILCGDGHCSFKLEPTSEKEQADFQANNVDWKAVDPILNK
jgi:hypothetical protein